MQNLVSDDELVYHIRQNNEEALDMLLFRYRDIRDVLIWETLKSNRYCGLEFDDLKQTAHEATLMVIATYDMKKSCFFSYWKLLVTRELRAFLMKHNGPSAAYLNTSLSFDDGEEYEKNQWIFQSPGCCENSITDQLNSDENMQRLAEDVDNGLTPQEKAVMAYRMLGYSYEEIATLLHFTNRKLCRVMLSMRSKVRTLSKDWA